MTSRASFLAATAAAALALGSFSADAAMPVAGAAQLDTGSDIVQAQATTPPAAATTTAPATTAAPAAATAAPAATTTTDPAAGQPKAKAKKTTSRQKEIDSSVQSGTVPKRYMQNVPKQYHDLIPWSK